MPKTNRKFYFSMLGILALLSAWPVVMGVKIVILQLQNGGIRPEDYARYVIPYTALCAAVLTSAALYPVLSRLKRLPVLAATALALVLFVGIELYMEGITIARPVTQSVANTTVTAKTAVDWQLASCFRSPDAVQAWQKVAADDTSMVGRALRQQYNDAFKIHYFLVSAVLITLITGVAYSYGKSFSAAGCKNRLRLNLQAASCALLLGLCVFANFTGFYRDATQYQSLLPSLLTGAFFVVLGAALGVYTGSHMIGRGRGLAVWLPAAVAVLVCAIMYYGEYRLLGGTLYRFGTSLLFTGLPGIAVAPVDVLVILLAGGVTAGVMIFAGKSDRKNMGRNPNWRLNGDSGNNRHA